MYMHLKTYMGLLLLLHFVSGAARTSFTWQVVLACEDVKS